MERNDLGAGANRRRNVQFRAADLRRAGKKAQNAAGAVWQQLAHGISDGLRRAVVDLERMQPSRHRHDGTIVKKG